MGLADTSPVPKKDPMGMDYVPVYADEAEAARAGIVRISPGRVQQIGVRSEPVSRRDLVRPIRAVGTVQFDERRTFVVSTRFEGWIEKLLVNATGETVRRGQPLMQVYSPDLVLAQQEYALLSKSEREKESGAGNAASRRLLAGAEQRLRYLDFPSSEMERLKREAEPREIVTIPSPVSGTVIEKPALQGMRFMPGETLYKIVDMSTVWLIAEVFEQDLATVAVGQPAKIVVKAYPDRSFAGRVAFIYPTVGEQTRTARVRIEIPNPGDLLKQEMYASVEITSPVGRRDVLAVPDFGGDRQRRAAGGANRPGRGAVRAAPGPSRRERRRLRRGPRRRRRRRAGGGRRQLPDRRREQPEGRAERLRRRGTPAPMISGLIRWSAHNLVLVLIGTVFIVAAGVYSLLRTPLDAIPDLSDVQVILYTEYPGQAPQVVEDQVTYPLTTAMLSVPHSKVVRGFSFFGVSFVYIIFEDGTDLYWARSRVLEYLNFAAKRLPPGITPSLGPDATGVGWVYQYAVLSEKRTLAELRTIQDWYLRYGLAKAEGVAEVASIGGFVKTYAVTVDPWRLKAYGIPLSRVAEAIRRNNRDVGGRVVEMTETEYVVRGRGYLQGIADLEQIVLKTEGLTPVLLRDVARIELAPDERRGLTELNGEGEVVSGIVLQRFGQNALDVIANVKKKIEEITPSLPEDVRIVTVYDRSDLIKRAIETLKGTLIEESIIVALVCIVFLLHVRSALVAIVSLPIGVLMAFIAMHALGINSTIMSLGGIAIAIGAMVDAAIVMVENAHKHLERAAPETPRVKALVDAAIEVGPALFFSLLIITVSFLPIFTLEAQEGRMFKPLAFTKTFSMAAAALLSITLVPALMVLFVRGRIIPEHKNPINRVAHLAVPADDPLRAWSEC